MKFIYSICLVVFCLSCEDAWEDPYVEYIIPKGKHSKTFPLELLQSTSLRFEAIFDESAQYQSLTEENQWDTNKLLGFSDCNSFHHDHSARFGWRWLNDSLEILAYCYVNGERVIETLGTVALGEASYYHLEITEDHYLFTLNSYPQLKVPRQNPCETGTYYMLFPYFGGDEVAPHDIRIKIKMHR